jgi:hypothetical protein
MILLTSHIRQQAEAKGIPVAALHEILTNPAITYKSFHTVNGVRQPRCCRTHQIQQETWTGVYEGKKVAISVAPCCNTAITTWLDQVETNLRADQVARGVVRYRDCRGEWRS